MDAFHLTSFMLILLANLNKISTKIKHQDITSYIRCCPENDISSRLWGEEGKSPVGQKSREQYKGGGEGRKRHGGKSSVIE